MIITMFATLIIGHQITLLFRMRRFDPFDVRVLIDLVLLIMWVYAPLVDDRLLHQLENDIWLAITTFLGIIFLYVGLHFPFYKETRYKQKQQLRRLADSQKRHWLWFALFLFIVATVVQVSQRVGLSGTNLIGYVSGNRLAIHKTILDQNQGSITGRLVAFTQPVLIFWFTLALERRRWLTGLLLYLVLLSSILLIATTRLPVILTVLLPIIYWVHKRKASWSVPTAALMGFIFISLMYILGIVRAQGVSAINQSGFTFQQALGSVASNFNPIRGYHLLWEMDRSGYLPHEYGLAYLYVPVTAIPRALWSEKPLTSTEARWTNRLFGSHFASSNAAGGGVWTFTVWGEGVIQFGILGIFLNLFIYGGLVKSAGDRFSNNRSFSLVWFYYSVLAATYLRSSTSALAWTFLQAFVPLILVIYWPHILLYLPVVKVTNKKYPPKKTLGTQY